MEHGYVWISSDLGTLGADLLVRPQVLGRKRVVGQVRVRTQQNSAVSMEGHPRGDVGMRADELHCRMNFGLGGRKRAGAVLLVLLPPPRGKVTVQVELLLARLQVDRYTIEVLDQSFGKQTKVLPAHFGRLAANHQPGITIADLPRTIRIRHAHRKDAAITVDVLALQSTDRLVVMGVRSCAGAKQLGNIRECQLRPVRVEPRADVERAAVEAARYVFV